MVTGLDHERDVNGACMPGCTACRVERLERTVKRVKAKCEEIASDTETNLLYREGARTAARLIRRELERGEAPDAG